MLHEATSAGELRIRDFRVLRALVEMQRENPPNSVKDVVKFIARKRQGAQPEYDEALVSEALANLGRHDLVLRALPWYPSVAGGELVHLTVRSNAQELVRYQSWFSDDKVCLEVALEEG